MFVLLAIEPLNTSDSTSLQVQIAAKRVSRGWEELDVFSENPPDISAFSVWLETAEEPLCFWNEEQRDLLKAAWKEHFGNEIPNLLLCVEGKVRYKLGEKVSAAKSLYEIAQIDCLIRQDFPHNLQNDLRILHRLCAKLEVSQKKLRKEMTPALGDRPLPERNRIILSKCQYNYVYAKASVVFHRKSCPCMLNVKSIEGSVFYDPAAYGRRPCLRCKPEPTIIAPEMAEKLPANGRYPHEAGSGDLVRMKLVSGHTEYLAKRTLVGFCHNNLHRGGLTKKLMEEHGCLEKGCTFFQKYLDRPYWQEQKSRKKKRAAAKVKKRAAREERQAAAEQLSLAKDKLQSLVTDEPFEIINVERLEPHTYTVFYVSDNPFADGNRFPAFLAAAKESFPGYRIMLRHIRDIDGRFVTREEYRKVRR